MNSKIIKNLIFLLLILFNLINKSLTNENHYPIFWIILDENGHYVDVLNCSEGIFNNGFPAEENKASTSYSAPQYSSDSASYYDFTQNGKMDWDYIYVELKILRKELIQYKEYDGDEVDELIYHMNLLENELKETIINKLGLENLIINLNLFLNYNEKKLYEGFNEGSDIYDLRKNVHNLFIKLKMEIFSDGIRHDFEKMSICFEKNKNAFRKMINVLVRRTIKNGKTNMILKRYETLRKYYLLNNAAKEIYSLLYKEILQPKYINFGQLNRATFYTPKRTFCESLCGIKSEIPFDEDVNIYLKIYWLIEYFVKNDLKELDENMIEKINFIEKNQALPSQWVNSVTYEAKYPSYKVKKFDQWTRNFNLTIAKLLVVYTRFARFYKLKTIYDEFVEKVNFNVGGKIFDEVNKWKLPEDFEELVNRRLNKILEKNKEEDEEEDEEE